MKKLAIILALAAPALGQIVVTPNIPLSQTTITNYGLPVFSGSIRQIAVDIGNGIIANGSLGYCGGGLGYVSGDVGSYLTIHQSGSSNTATFLITAVAGGCVTGISSSPTIAGTGYHTSDPNGNGETTTGGSGSGMQVKVAVTQCATPTYNCTINWSASGTGGATATFTDPTHTAVSSISAGYPTVQVNVGGTGTNCTTSPSSGSAGPYTLTCASTVTVTAQSTDDNTKSATFVFDVIANAGATLANGEPSVKLYPAYNQAYSGQSVPLWTNVVGSSITNAGVTYAITQAGGGNGVLDHTNPANGHVARKAYFSATVAGDYKVTATSATTGGSATAVIHVSSTALPYNATTKGTVPFPCEADATYISTIYEVGSGYTYADYSSVPYISTSAAGVMVRFHNTGGASPSTFANQIIIHNEGGTIAGLYGQASTAPYVICGVADGLGNMPKLTGNQAVTQSSAANTLTGCGLINIIGTSHSSFWQAGSTGPVNMLVAGLDIEDGQTTDYYTGPTGFSSSPCGGTTGPGAGQSYWGVDAAGIYVGGGAYVTVEGNYVNNWPNGLFTAENADSNAWSTVTQEIASIGNVYTGCFNSGGPNAHCIYAQSYFFGEEGDTVGGAAAGVTNLGADFKWRGLGLTQSYNKFLSGAAVGLDYVDQQDGFGYSTWDGYLTSAFWGAGDTAGVNVVAGYEEWEQAIFSFGNQLLWNTATGYQSQIIFGADHSGAGTTTQNGTLYFYNNTVPVSQILTESGPGIQNQPYLQPKVQLQNNILWSPFAYYALNYYLPFVSNGLTNMFYTSSMVITTPITGGSYSSHSAHGWQSGCSYTCPWPLTSPLDPYTTNLSSGNYLTAASLPVNGSTLIPASGSSVISSGSALAGPTDLLPVRWQRDSTSTYLIPRINPLTIGSNDEGSTSTGSQASGLTLQGVIIQ